MTERSVFMNMKEINLLYKETIEKKFEENLRSSKVSQDYLESSTAKYKGRTIYSLYMPKLFTDEDVAYLKEKSETMYRILVKVMQEYFEKEDYRELFGFDDELKELILKRPPYYCLLPICRLDIFLNEEDRSFKYCEFNADGSSSMNEDRELNIALKLTQAYKDLTEEYEFYSFELFDSWVKTFMDIYNTSPLKVDNPHIAITDFLEKGCSIEEFTEFKKAFERAGYSAEICEIRNFTFDGESLISPTGRKVDAIYRRAVTTDIMHNKAQVQPFLNAVKQNKVCLIGDFCTQIIHNKILFYILHMDRTKQFLTAEEAEYIDSHIPKTVKLNDRYINELNVLSTKDRWIIKPEDSYGAKGVYAGIHFTDGQWASLIDKHKNSDYIIQEFIMPYPSYNIDFKKKHPEFKLYSNLTGMYMYGGKLAGFYSRQSKKEIISTEHDENDVASTIIRKKRV